MSSHLLRNRSLASHHYTPFIALYLLNLQSSYWTYWVIYIKSTKSVLILKRNTILDAKWTCNYIFLLIKFARCNQTCSISRIIPNYWLHNRHKSLQNILKCKTFLLKNEVRRKQIEQMASGLRLHPWYISAVRMRLPQYRCCIWSPILIRIVFVSHYRKIYASISNLNDTQSLTCHIERCAVCICRRRFSETTVFHISDTLILPEDQEQQD